MLHLLLNLIETIKLITYYTFMLSYNTGKIIVCGLITSLKILQQLLNTLWTVIVILEEDLYVFVVDLWDKVMQILYEFQDLTEYISENIVTVINWIKLCILGTSSAIITVFQNIVNAISKIFTTFGAIIAGIKHLLVLFGSGVWFALTLIPLCCVYICAIVGNYVWKIYEEIKTILYLIMEKSCSGIKDVFHFITDVPLESLAGLLICFCLLYTIFIFHLTLYNKMKQFLQFTITVAYLNILFVKSFLYERLTTQETPSESDSETSSSGSEYIEEEIEIPVAPPGTNEGWITKRERQRQIMESGERLCIICMERNKCILAMPCRHMCTCKECNDTLRNYQHTCPICRRYVNYTIHVY